jgi:hypothetical protein
MASSGAAPAHDGAPWELVGGRHPAASKAWFQWGFILRHRGDARRSFRSPSNGGGRRWRLATERWFAQDLTMLRAAYGASPMMGIAPTGAVDLCEAPGMDGLARAATLTRRRGRAVGLGLASSLPKTGIEGAYL